MTRGHAAAPACVREPDLDSLYTRWLSPLQHLCPAAGVLHVGAGTGASLPPYAGARVPRVRLVEADRERLPELEALARTRAGWSSELALVGAGGGETDFFVASNPNESGLIDAVRLQGIWRNLRVREHRRMVTTTLQALLTGAPEINWLVVDCMPALAILHGAGAALAQLEVLLARVVLPDDTVTGHGAALSEIDPWLQEQGFRIMATAEERHPTVGMALYLRDWKGAHSRQQREIDLLHAGAAETQRQLNHAREHAALAAERQAELQQLTQAKAGADKLAADRKAQLDALTQGKAAADKLATDRLAQVEALTLAKAAVDKLAAERAAQLEQMTKANEEQAALATERQTRLQATIQAKAEADELAADRKTQLDGLTQSHAATDKLAADRQAQIDALMLAKAAADKLGADRAAQLEELTKAREEQAALAAERQSRLQQLTQAKVEADKLAADRKAQLDALTQAKAAADRQTADRAAQITQLTQARDEQAKAAAEALARADALAREKAQTLAERDALGKEKPTLVAARDEQARLAREAEQRRQQAEAELAEMAARYGLLQEELIKAEAQVELIADLLLRGATA